jgi:hypothetical protein
VLNGGVSASGKRRNSGVSASEESSAEQWCFSIGKAYLFEVGSSFPGGLCFDQGSAKIDCSMVFLDRDY